MTSIWLSLPRFAVTLTLLLILFEGNQTDALGGTVKPAASQPLHTTTQPGPAGCTLVELYPGYPGYRGNITGVMPHWNGLGDWECLETLERTDRAFDQAYEDRANQQAADALGINGPKELWTWENWLLIEVERGLRPSCYTCLMLDPATAPIRADISPDPEDPRLLTGVVGETRAIDRIAVDVYGSSPISLKEHFGNDDYVLRALAYYVAGPSLNARELLDEMHAQVEVAMGFSRTVYPPEEILRQTIWETGGYVPVSERAAPSDQVMLMLYAFGVASIHMPAELRNYNWFEFDRTVTAWSSGAGGQSLQSYMQQQPTWQEFR